MTENFLYSDLTAKIIRAFYKVYNCLGYGFVEKVYENAMLVELTDMGLVCNSQMRIEVFYKDQPIGFYVADINIENKIIIELKAADALSETHEATLVNYLRATDIEVGLLLNFGPKPAFKRKVFTNIQKDLRKSNQSYKSAFYSKP